MQQRHPRRKQLDRAEYEMKMYRRRKRKEAIDVLCDVYRAIGQTVKEASKEIQKAFRKYGSSVN